MGFSPIRIYTTLKLEDKVHKEFPVLVPSEITLLSNSQLADRNGVTVLVPSKFTLLSNLKSQIPTSNRERDTEICAVGEI